MIPTAAPSSTGDGGGRCWAVRPARRSSSVLRHRLPMRSSPYVGWFRHAPPSSSSSRRAPGTWVGVGFGRPRSHSFTSSGSTMGRYQALRRHSSVGVSHGASVAAASSFRGGAVYARAPSSLGRMKSSPYVGWFRHAPPSRVRVQGTKFGEGGAGAFAKALDAAVRMSSQRTVHRSKGEAKTLDSDDESFVLETLPISKLVKEMAGGRRRYYVDGRLRGGCPLHEEDGGGCREQGVFPFEADGDGGSSSFPGSTPLTPFDHHRVFDSIHQSASTRGLHFNAFAQDEYDTSDEQTSSDAFEKSSSDLLSSIGDASVQEDGDDEDGLSGSSPSSATIGVLNRLAHWFAPTLTHSDALSHYQDFARSTDAANELYNHVGPGVTTAMFPLFAGMLRRALMLEDGEAAADLEGDDGLGLGPARKYPWEGEEGSQRGDDTDVPTEVERSQETSRDNQASPPGRAAATDTSRLLEVSVSSLAEAYYAHQASKEFLEAAEQSAGLGPSSPPPSLASSPAGHGHDLYGSAANHHPLDYVITQIDIARMVRNASRHLDVESILSLPTITYRSKKTKKEEAEGEGTSNEDGGREKSGEEDKDGGLRRRAGHDAPTATDENNNDDEDFAWSWMIVPPNPEGGHSQEAATTSSSFPGAPARSTGEVGGTQDRVSSLETEDHNNNGGGNDDEHCVICLDHFVDGDRLRVLPCSHLFHAGCIDRWLSGAASHEECFTAGCPTCKERPYGMMASSGAGCSGLRSASPESGVLPGGGASASAGAKRCSEEEGLFLAESGAAPAGEAGEAAVSSSSLALDGSVPRWAFARLGDAMAGRARPPGGAPVPEGA